MKPLLVLACVASSVLVSACMVREERVVQPAPATAAVSLSGLPEKFSSNAALSAKPV